MPQIYTEIEINAPPAAVRSVFLDFPKYPEWHTGFAFERVTPETPEIQIGEKIRVIANGTTFVSTLVENTPEVFRWLGELPLSLFSGEHVFRFEPSKKTPNGTTFIQSEEFTGWFSFIMNDYMYIGPQTKQIFEALNKSLKKKVEGDAKA